MKTEISRDSHQPKKRYSGVYQQQGRMLTDADWNELVEILKERLNEALKDVVGSKEGSIGGSPRHRKLKIIKAIASDPLTIQPGYVYVDGVAAQIPGPNIISYEEQLDFPSPPNLPIAFVLPKPPIFPPLPSLPELPDLLERPDTIERPELLGQPGLIQPPILPSIYYVLYADVWERTVTHLMDERLRDKGLHGADTCTRKQTMAQIKWCPGTNNPENLALNPAKGDAELTVSLLPMTTQPDLCDPCASQLDVESKVGNYLFRVEVHDVVGDANAPTEFTLKWSSENGAVQYVLKGADVDGEEIDIEPPSSFKNGKWVYEFYDETSEKHLGVHLENRSDWQPIRNSLNSEYNKPSGDLPSNFVRRWDGYCKLVKSDPIWKVDKLFDKTKPDSDSHAVIDAGTLTINLEALKLELKLDHSFVAGDYWLADVREAQYDALNDERNKLIENKHPIGIEHHYLMLGTVKNGVLQPNPEADRKYAFPSLTEMKRMFHVAGDGQEAMPEYELQQPIEVGVANGEWPVNDAKVRFTIEGDTGGAISVTQGSFATTTSIVVDSGSDSDDGVAKCYWKLGDGVSPNLKGQRVMAELLGPDGSTALDHPPLYFNANLSTADQVAYDPTQKPERWEDINEEDEDGIPLKPVTVQQALDNLVENLESSDIVYRFLDDCANTTYGAKSLNSYIREDLGKTAPDSRTRIEDLWDKLLCLLDANRIPYDSILTPEVEKRWKELLSGSGLSQPQNIQSAIDDLLIHLGQGGGGLASIINELVKSVALSGSDNQDDDPNLPAIHDITTDTANPPNFVALLSVREASPNGAAYDYDARDEQIAAYPEILPLYIKGAKVAGATALAESQARKMGWEIAAIEPELGRIEATDTTFWFGYKDDIIIRLTAKEDGVMVDLRSVSRVGIGDLGANAKRIESFLSALKK